MKQPAHQLRPELSVHARPCPLCQAPAGEACQPKPEANHLARWLSAYMAGQLSKAYMGMVLGELVVIDKCVVIPAQAAPQDPPTAENLTELERLLVTGHRLTYTEDKAAGGWWADLRAAGRMVAIGLGRTKTDALKDLARRLGGAR